MNMPKPIDAIFPGDKGQYFTAPKDDPEDIPEEVRELRDKAEQGALEDKTDRCVFCKKAFFFYAADKGVCQGHVYSTAGAKETQISGICEFCFDATTGDDE
jgi:hypothetical protein